LTATISHETGGKARSDIQTTLQPMLSDSQNTNGALATLTIDPWLKEYFDLPGQ